MAIIKKSTNNKGWRECGEKWTLLHCWWKWKVIQPLWRMVWKFLLKARNKTTMCLIAQLCLALCDPMDCSPPGSCVHEDSPGKNTGVGCHTLLQGILLTQGSNPGLLHCRQILYCLGHQGSPYLIVWISHISSPILFLFCVFSPLAATSLFCASVLLMFWTA